tara:strand:+ start:1408 stop:1632 length:225 start_codon:yes stop_codon:yes gene_type:complete
MPTYDYSCTCGEVFEVEHRTARIVCENCGDTAERMISGDCTCSPVDMVPGWPEEACEACVKASNDWDAAGRPGE